MADPTIGSGGVSERARAVRDAALPGLLAAVRWRRRRRHAVRVALAAVLVAGGVGLWWPRDEPGPVPSPPAPVAGEPAWRTVPTDPTVLQRCAVPTTVRADWFVDDATLRDLLRDDDRPSGLVRARGQVLVSAAAIDPFPSVAP